MILRHEKHCETTIVSVDSAGGDGTDGGVLLGGKVPTAAAAAVVDGSES